MVDKTEIKIPKKDGAPVKLDIVQGPMLNGKKTLKITLDGRVASTPPEGTTLHISGDKNASVILNAAPNLKPVNLEMDVAFNRVDSGSFELDAVSTQPLRVLGSREQLLHVTLNRTRKEGKEVIELRSPQDAKKPEDKRIVADDSGVQVTITRADQTNKIKAQKGSPGVHYLDFAEPPKGQSRQPIVTFGSSKPVGNADNIVTQEDGDAYANAQMFEIKTKLDDIASDAGKVIVNGKIKTATPQAINEMIQVLKNFGIVDPRGNLTETYKKAKPQGVLTPAQLLTMPVEIKSILSKVNAEVSIDPMQIAQRQAIDPMHVPAEKPVEGFNPGNVVVSTERLAAKTRDPFA